jgi:hypothetical protein
MPANTPIFPPVCPFFWLSWAYNGRIYVKIAIEDDMNIYKENSNVKMV